MAIRKTEQFDPGQVALADFYRSLSHPARLAILDELATKQCQCGEIVSELPLAQSTVSQHLRQLRDAGLVRGEIDGPAVCYCLNPDRMLELTRLSESFLNSLQSFSLHLSAQFREDQTMNATTGSPHDPEFIKSAVREQYRRSAEAGSCCDSGPSCGCGSCTDGVIADSAVYAEQAGYVSQADLGLGCGFPTRAAGIKNGETVLDLGCGAGNDMFLAAAAVGPTGMVYGVDMTPEMISRGRQLAAERKVSNVRFLLGELEALPVADNSIDLALSNCVINLVPDKGAVFHEIARVLRPGGRLVFSDMVATAELPAAVRESVALHVGCVAGVALLDEYIGMMRAAGFADISIVERSTVSPALWGGGDGDLGEAELLSVTFVCRK